MKNFKFKWLLLSIVLSIASINTTWAYERTFDGTERVFFKNIKPSGWGDCWIGGGRTGWIHFWRSGYANVSDVKLTLVSGSEGAEGAIYVCTPAAGTYTDVTLVRSSTSATMSWTEKSKDISVGSDGSLNYINNLSPSDWGENYGHWAKYAPTPAVVGSMNGWKAEANPATSTRFTESSQKVQIIPVTLAASTTYTFRVITGEDLYGKTSLTITGATKDGSWESYSTGDGKDVTLTTDEAGEYIFQFNESSKYVAVYYPKGRFTKNKVVYFNASGASSSYWNQATFDSKFYFKYYDSGTNVDGGSFCNATNKLEGNVYYATVPNDDWAGQIVIDRYNPNDHNEETGKWNTSGVAYATGRSSSAENCFGITSDSWTPSLGGWTTYCPPMSAASLSDNSTSKISWKNGSGTSEDPYLVPATGTIKVSASATSAVPADDNMTKNYDFKVNTGSGASSAQKSTTSTFNKGSLTNNTTYEISLDTWNSYNGATGTKKTDAPHIWYKALNMYSVTPSLTNMSVKAGERTGSNAAAYQIAYSVVFNANTGYNRPASVTVMRGSTDITANCTWTQGTGTLSIPAAQVTGNITITAAGVAKTYSITLDDNGEYEGDGTATATYYTTTLAVISAPTRTGYHVTGYYTSDGSLYIADAYGNLQADKSGYTDGSSRWTKDADATLYAHWEANTHSLSWNANGGDELTGSYTNGTTAYGTTIVKPNTPTQSGYVFKGWAESESGAVVSVPATMPDANKSYYAQWLDIDDVASTCWDGSGNYLCGSITNLATPKPATSANWSDDTWGGTPSLTTDVVIPSNMAMTVDVDHAQAKSISLGSSSTLSIDPNKGLEVAGTITKADGSAPTASDLVLGSSASGNATLIFNNSNSAAATVGMYSIASVVGSTWNWQYMASPYVSAGALHNYYGSYLYRWGNGEDETTGWFAVPNGGSVVPFVAYCITNKTAGTYYQMDGTMVATDGNNQSISVPEGKSWVVGNSWTAPIQIGQLQDDDFEGLLKNVYLYNTGMDDSGEALEVAEPTGDARYAANTYVSIPIHAAPYSGISVVSSLQGFYVKDDPSEAGGGTLKLNYTNHVRPIGENSILNGAMHAPKRIMAEDNEPNVLKIKVCGSKYDDRLVLLERADFSMGYDAGWDGDKMGNVAASPRITVEREDGTSDAVSAVPDLEGLAINFRAANTDNQQTLYFEYSDKIDPLYIVDVTNNEYTRVLTGNSYTFSTSDNEEHPRFILTRYGAPQITTGVDEVYNANSARKQLINGTLYIIRDGRIYNAEGALVK